MEKKKKQDFFRRLYQDYFGKLANTASALVDNRESGEDIAQDTFLIAWRHIDELMDYQRPYAWLVRTLRNQIGDYYRLRKRVDKLSQELIAERDGTHRDELSVCFLYGGAVTREELQLLIWFYVENLTAKAIAEKLGINDVSCRKRIQRAKEHLREAMKNDG